MTKSQIFKLAHALARDDMDYNPSLPEIMRKSYAYYFRLQLKSILANERIARTGICTGFQVYERRVWA